MADYVGGDMIRGHIDTIILNSLIDGDKDTNQIKSEIEERAAGQFQLKQGTFYSALQRIVKQGYVIEYRTTGADGVRRKFFQLTEKGKDHIDKNQSSWTMSRQVINTLLDAQAEKIASVKAKQQEEEEVLPEFDPVPEFSSLDKTDPVHEESTAEQVISSIDDQYQEEDEPAEVETIEEIDEVAAALNAEPQTFNPENVDAPPQTFDDIMDILEKIDREAREEEERKAREEQERIERERLLAEQKEKEEAERIAREEQERIERERLLAEQEQREEEERKAALERAAKEAESNVIPFDSGVQESLEQPEIPESEQMAMPVKQNEPDDFLNTDDLPVQKEYREVLSRIFATSNSEQPASKPVIEFADESSETQIEREVETATESEEKYDRIVEELDFPQPEEKEKAARSAERAKKSGSTFDYTDIIEMSQREGFRVTTSDRTNKSELGKILINRLNFHTSVIFFVLLALETLIVGLTMEHVLKLGTAFYVYFTAIALLLPIVCGMIYYMAPKRTIAEVSTFKSAFETALIITLNLILMILVYVVIIDLDFSVQQDIARNLFLPLLLVLNLPIYIIIRYSLLEKQMYFS